MSLFKPSVSEFGQIKNIWTESYSGQKSHFVNNNTLIYSCGPTIKFYNTETKQTLTFQPPNLNTENEFNSINLLTANSAINKFAFTETQLSPKVFIYDFETVAQEQSKLLDGAVIEYLAIEFSNSEAILTLSGVPDLQIIIWNWKTGKRLFSINLHPSLGQPSCMYFCPINWRRLIVAYKSEINIWNLEQFDNDRIKSTKKRFILPPTDRNVEEEQVGAQFKEEFSYNNLAITGLDENLNDRIEEILDKRERHAFGSLCWVNFDEILVSTRENHIFKYNVTNNLLVKCVYKPDEIESDRRFSIGSEILIIRMFLHRQGVFALCDDGHLKILEGIDLPLATKKEKMNPDMYINKIINTNAELVTNLSFNTKYTHLAISTNRGIEILDCNKLFANESENEIVSLELDVNNQIRNSNENRLELAVNYDCGRIVGADSVLSNERQILLVLNEHGTIQVWNLDSRSIVSRFNLNEMSSCFATHPFMPLAVVGTRSGSLVFIDFSNHLYPRVLENCNLHKNSVNKLKFNSSGTILFSIGDDNKIFLIDVTLNSRLETLISKLDQRLTTNQAKKSKFEPGFYVLGYLEYEGEAVCVDTFDYDETQGEQKFITRVAVGIHDQNTWEVTKKSLTEAPALSSSMQVSSSSSDSSVNLSHSLLVHNLQTESAISRMAYSNLSSPSDFCLPTSRTIKLASKVLLFEFSYKLLNDKSQLYSTKKLDFKDEIINRSTFHSQYLFSDCALTARNYLIVFAERFMSKLSIPENEPAKKVPNKMAYLEFNEVIGCHDFGYGCFSKTNNNQFVISGGFDGSVQIRKTLDLKAFISARAAHFGNGGVQMIRLSLFDPKSILAIGFDNTIQKLEWNCTNEQTAKLLRQLSLEGDFNVGGLKNLIANQESKSSEETWYEMNEQEFFKEQDRQYLPTKKEIINGLIDIKNKLNELMSANQNREDLAKLKEHEFYLDLEELERLNKEADGEILKIKEKNELENTSKLYIREKIKNECWDDMKIKGRGINAFNSNLLVENYPLKEKSKEEQNLLDRIKLIRNIELKIQKTRNELTADLMRRENVNELFEIEEDDGKENETLNTTGQNNQVSTNILSPNLTQLSYKGSISTLFNGDTPLLYSQFELYTREQKWIQITLIQECILKIKENFNKEFESVMQRKFQEIAKIKEKNQRLKQIYVDLNEEREVEEPILGDSENPEILFEVKDDEINVEKYLSPEQRRLLEEQMAEDAKKREQERLDNWRERGLMDMMGGVLQIRREDELKKEIPMPAFMKEKPQEEWTVEEQAQYQVYENKVKELNEERAKLKKQLNVEINKINEQILECYQNFDNVLFGLHQRKVKAQQAIFQEELKIVRLVNSLIVDSELETYDNQINKKLERLKDEKKELTQEIQQVKKALEAFKVEYEILLAEDKSQEKAFIREFSDVSSSIREQLLRQFKKRPKQRIALNKTVLSSNPVQIAELGVDNPFSDRPSTAQQLSITEAETQFSLADLDKVENAPVGVDQSIWERFVEFRRNKISMENSLKMKLLNLNEMALYLQKRMEDDEMKKHELDDYGKSALVIQELRLRAFHNLQVQLLLKQGQVEINPSPYVRNLENCLLINRNVVESLNKIIQDHGKQKISIMVDSKDYRKGIRQLEWEHKKMKMTIEDYNQKQRDITYLKLTREVQEFLNAEDYDGKKQKEISILEQTVAYKKEQYEKVYGNKSKKFREIRDQSTKVANENENLDDELKNKNVVLYDRKHIEDELTGKTIDTIRVERFQQIIQRRKLVDLAKAQAQEVAFLRSEVERLRMKTFPALVQIEF